MGSKLKKARNAFMKAMIIKRYDNEVGRDARIKNIPAMKIFVAGPAMEIFPLSSLVGIPHIVTAPGAAKTTPKNMPRNRANISPWGNILNSDQ